MPSRRIYITLNDSKEKDKAILNYLSQVYSESDTIKEILYLTATNSTNKVHIGVNVCNKVQTGTKNIRHNEEQKGAINTVKVQKEIKPKRDKTVQVVPDNTDKGQTDILKKTELEQLKKFI